MPRLRELIGASPWSTHEVIKVGALTHMKGAALPCRNAIKHAPNAAMEAGVAGNLGALLLGVAGRVEDGLELIERCIQRFSDARIVANPLYAGAPLRRTGTPAGGGPGMLAVLATAIRVLGHLAAATP